MAPEAGADLQGRQSQAWSEPTRDRRANDRPALSSGGRRRFSEEQIRAIMGEASSGVAIVALCRRHGISTTTFFRWRKRYETAPSPLRLRQPELRELEDENRRLKILLAEAILENAAIRNRYGQGSPFGRT